MPRLIKDGAIVDSDWLPANPERPTPGHILSLDQWLELDDKSGSVVQLEPGDGVTPLLDHLDDLDLVAVNFPAFTDGRGFSYGRELRERGFAGELRAVGEFIRDQLDYLQRCGFNAFQFANESQLDAALDGLTPFSEHYQADVRQPVPLFRRRS
jgi:uncharacterized protein (DUF934 family)